MTEVGRVGIVLVSHSAGLAAGTAELADQVGGGEVTVVPAGGTDDGRLGTSIDKVRQALIAADSGAGVVVIPDLGSSVLTVRALLADDACLPDPLAIADGPFVEGAVAATIAAAVGGDVKAVATAAEEARHARKL
jgi:phosphoenolpyruvate---glycerone phosphotransferase subunit DhaM